MRSKSLFSAAIALAGVCSWFTPGAHAADAKSKAAAEKKKAAELHADDKSMKKQLQWEDKVLGPDDKRAELDKIARAHAINEKAEREKERQAALEPAPAPAAKPSSKKAEVALPSAPEEKPVAPREVSPKLATEAAQKPVAPTKPADDKFIDKLLKEEHPSNKKRASASDSELENLLAGAKGDKPAGRKNKGDSVDDLLKSADKGPAMPAPRAASALPDWAKTPTVAPATPAPVAKAAPKKDEGVIQVVQGAAASFDPPPPPPPVATRTPAPRKSSGRTASAKAPEWNDPFADKKSSAREQDRFVPAASVTRKEPAARPAAPPAAGWSDPFADMQEVRKPRRASQPTPPAPAATAPAAPSKRNNSEKPEPSAHPPGWKDPFTKAPAEPARAAVAMRELGKNESSKWEIASHRGARSAPVETHPATGWAILKKRAR